MIEAQQISTSSTLNDCHTIISKSPLESQEKEEEIPEWQKCSSKRFKNLVECYPCKVDDCQILFETKEELLEHSKSHANLNKAYQSSLQEQTQVLLPLRGVWKKFYCLL